MVGVAPEIGRSSCVSKIAEMNGIVDVVNRPFGLQSDPQRNVKGCGLDETALSKPQEFWPHSCVC